MHSGNIFAAIPDSLDKELFEQIVQTKAVRIERIVSTGQTAPESGWYDQEQSEWVMVLQGGAIIAFEDGAEVNLRRGDYLNISAHSKHKVSWTDPESETIWLAVRY
ncbi:MAG: cupin domain-containing protein [Gammaproteobacteria bacterium]|nr:cupin domain-containing protein [Gammaproteobacteria bacterium]